MNEKAIRAQLRVLGLPQPGILPYENGSWFARWVVLDGRGRVQADWNEVTFACEDGAADMDDELLGELVAALRAAGVWHRAASGRPGR